MSRAIGIPPRTIVYRVATNKWWFIVDQRSNVDTGLMAWCIDNLGVSNFAATDVLYIGPGWGTYKGIWTMDHDIDLHAAILKFDELKSYAIEYDPPLTTHTTQGGGEFFGVSATPLAVQSTLPTFEQDQQNEQDSPG